MGSRVLILGHDEAGSLMHSYARGFREHGLGVETYCLARALATITRIPRNRVADRLLARRRGDRLSSKVVDDLQHVESDLALVLKGEHLRPAAIQAMRARLGCPVINYYPDDPFSEIAVNRPVFGPAVLRTYDGCYTFARRLVHAYRNAGVTEVEWLAFARDPELHAPASDPQPPRTDVVFVGNLDRHRVQWLEPLGRFRLEIYGDLRTNRRAVLRARRLHTSMLQPPVVGPEMSRALAGGAVSVNVLREQNKGSHNMRSYESLACGAFTVSESSPEIQALFNEGVELVTVAEPQELESTVEQWLGDPEGRARVARAGFKRVENDTYGERCRSILERWLS